MFSIVFFALIAIAVLLLAIWWSPKFKETVAYKWGWIGTALLALAAWVAAWWTEVPVELPPM